MFDMFIRSFVCVHYLGHVRLFYEDDWGQGC
jgi:hypothetical protein